MKHVYRFLLGAGFVGALASLEWLIVDYPKVAGGLILTAFIYVFGVIIHTGITESKPRRYSR